MQVLVGVVREIIVDHNVHLLDINTTAEKVSSYKDSLVEFLEGLVSGNSLLLLQAGVDAHGREVVVIQESVQLSGAVHLRHENNDLVKLKSVQKIIQLAVLLFLGKADVELLQTVKGQFGVIIDENLHRILAEFSAHGADFLVEGGRKHHNLLLMRSGTENRLHVLAHTELGQHVIALVKNEVLHLGEVQVLSVGKIKDATRGTNNNVRLVVSKGLNVLLNVDTSVEDAGLNILQVLGESLIFSLNLVRQFTGVCEHQHMHFSVDRGDLVQSSQNEHRGLSHS
mmetsp:Transcript_24253/g.41165  ORF Transcript_24253/g.41165 Transcript_24253/m.41165 type:complete len:283 (-) Transcript_24253:275-1123(-)